MDEIFTSQEQEQEIQPYIWTEEPDVIQEEPEPEQIQEEQEPEPIQLEQEIFTSSELMTLNEEIEQIPEEILPEQTQPIPEELPQEQKIVEEPIQQAPSSTGLEQIENLEIQKQILETLKKIEENGAPSSESETEAPVIEEATETTTDVLQVIRSDLSEMQKLQKISVKDQQTIGLVQTGTITILLGAIVIWLFLGRIR